MPAPGTIRILFAGCLLLTIFATAWAQPVSLLGVDGGQTDATPAAGTGAAGTGTPGSGESDFQKVVAKLQAGELLSEKEFIVYLRGLEAANPRLKWAHIITKLHDWYYAPDATLVFFGIPLFKNTKENEGWQNVDLCNVTPPKFIKNDSGETVDIAHSYAGVRALIGRNKATGWAMGNVNTGWGDTTQVVGGKIVSVKNVAVELVTFDWQGVKQAAGEWGNSNNYKPPDQERGNKIGMQVESYLSKNRQSKLSDAYASVLGE